VNLFNSIDSFPEKRNILIARSKPIFFPYFVSSVYANLLSQSKGALHIGAHVGQEASIYAQSNLDVLRIEGIAKYLLD
jgi:hypothetical protein